MMFKDDLGRVVWGIVGFIVLFEIDLSFIFDSLVNMCGNFWCKV